MGRAVFLFLAILAGSSLAYANEPPKPAPLEIRPAEADWGADPADVEKLLRSTAAELWCYFPGRRLSTIVVEPKGGPITLFARGPKGEIHVKLNTGDTYWAQYAYQFAHEFGHILANYDEDENRHKWFEESLCEMASLFTLRKMARTWQTTPPYPNWKAYSSALEGYARQRIDDARLPEGETLEQWFQEHAASLDGQPYDRAKNNVVAVRLLPLFEEHPVRWEAITWLNAVESTRGQSFEQYLRDWQMNCPQRHRAFVGEVAAQFGVRLEPLK